MPEGPEAMSKPRRFSWGLDVAEAPWPLDGPARGPGRAHCLNKGRPHGAPQEHTGSPHEKSRDRPRGARLQPPPARHPAETKGKPAPDFSVPPPPPCPTRAPAHW